MQAVASLVSSRAAVLPRRGGCSGRLAASYKVEIWGPHRAHLVAPALAVGGASRMLTCRPPVRSLQAAARTAGRRVVSVQAIAVGDKVRRGLAARPRRCRRCLPAAVPLACAAASPLCSSIMQTARSCRRT